MAPDLSLPEWVVLAVVDEAPTHGFAVSRLTAAGGELGRVWAVPRPVVYRALDRLVTAKRLRAVSTEPGRGPRRQVYASTAAGRRELSAWLLTPVEHVREVRSQLLCKLALLDRRGVDPTPLLVRQREILAPIADAYDERRWAAQGFDATLVAWRRANTAAALAFLDDLARPS